MFVCMWVLDAHYTNAKLYNPKKYQIMNTKLNILNFLWCTQLCINKNYWESMLLEDITCSAEVIFKKKKKYLVVLL